MTFNDTFTSQLAELHRRDLLNQAELDRQVHVLPRRSHHFGRRYIRRHR